MKTIHANELVPGDMIESPKDRGFAAPGATLVVKSVEYCGYGVARLVAKTDEGPLTALFVACHFQVRRIG